MNWESEDAIIVYYSAERNMVVVGDMYFDLEQARELGLTILEAVDEAGDELKQVARQLSAAGLM